MKSILEHMKNETLEQSRKMDELINALDSCKTAEGKKLMNYVIECERRILNQLYYRQMIIKEGTENVI